MDTSYEYPPNTWVEIVATKCEGGPMTWLNVVLADVNTAHRLRFNQWEDLYNDMTKKFEFVTKDEAVTRYFAFSTKR